MRHWSDVGLNLYLWNCEMCLQRVEGPGPWCQLYMPEHQRECRPHAKMRLRQADAEGDGPLVDALCRYGRKEYGEDIDW